MKTHKSLNRHLSEKFSVMTDKRWCSSHNDVGLIEGGKWIDMANHRRRWICANCLQRRHTKC